MALPNMLEAVNAYAPISGMPVDYFVKNYGSPIGSSSIGTYYSVPKADGGQDFYRVAGTDIRAISQADVANELGVAGDDYNPTPTPTQQTGPTQAQISSAIADYNAAVAKAARDYEAGMRSYQDQFDKIKANREQIGQQRDKGIRNNEGYFNQISPDAFSSQLVNYNNEVLDSYKRGAEDLGKQEERIGQSKNDYVADYNMGVDSMNRNLQDYIGGSSTSNFAPINWAAKVASPTMNNQSVYQGVGSLNDSTPQANQSYGWTTSEKSNLSPLEQYLYGIR